jgi:hypothetical protein
VRKFSQTYELFDENSKRKIHTKLRKNFLELKDIQGQGILQTVGLSSPRKIL